MSEQEKKSCVVLVSGGLDSAVTLALAMDRGFAAHGLTVRYGQRHKIETGAASRVCKSLKVEEHRFIDLNLRLFGASALTDEMAVPKGPRLPEAEHIPSTYVPARNTIFLSLALAWAEAIGSHDIFIGVSAIDYSGYPDCRPEFVDAFETMANLGTRAADSGEHFNIHAPLIQLTKAKTVQLGIDLGVDFSLTWSCYDPTPEGMPCGECESCVLRAGGFTGAGVPDPLLRVSSGVC